MEKQIKKANTHIAMLFAAAFASLTLCGNGQDGLASLASAAGGKLLCHLSFDDPANPLKAKVGADAIVRTGRDAAVPGLGDAKWEANGGDGALLVPRRTHIAIPIPNSLAKQPGQPYSIEMKVRFLEPEQVWCCLMNMPAENTSDAIAFLTTQNDRRVVLKASGRVEGAGIFKLGEWNTFFFQFGQTTTRVFVDGREVFKQDFALAGSRADCSKAGGYFLFAADDTGEDAPMYIADVKIYDGIAAPSATPTSPKTQPANPKSGPQSPATDSGVGEDEESSGEGIAKKYFAIDLSGGPNAAKYPIEPIYDMPVEGWGDEYKTTKMLFHIVRTGKFTMGSPKDELGRWDDETQHEVTITKPFFMGVYEVTQKQYELVMGTNPSSHRGDMRPVECVNVTDIRGDSTEYNWPETMDVAPDSFIGRLRAKTGLPGLDLPTEAQWERACRAIGITALHGSHNLSSESVSEELAKIGRYRHNQSDGNGGYNSWHTAVGSYRENAWFFHDMLGNVWEWCLDWYGPLGAEPAVDPVGPVSGPARVCRGGSLYDEARYCRCAKRGCDTRAGRYDNFGFRVCFNADRAGLASAETEEPGCRYPGPQPGDLKVQEPVRMPDVNRPTDRVTPEENPSKEAQETQDTNTTTPANTPAATNPAGGGDGGKQPATTDGGNEPQPGGGKKPEGETKPPEDGDDDVCGKIYSVEEPWNYAENSEKMQCEFDDEDVPDDDEYVGYWKRVGVRVFYEINSNIQRTICDEKGDDRPIRKSFSVTPTSLKCRIEVPTGWRISGKSRNYTSGWVSGSIEWSEPPLIIKKYLYGQRPSNIRLRYTTIANNAISREDSYSDSRWAWRSVGDLYLCSTSRGIPEGLDWSLANNPEAVEKIKDSRIREFWKYRWRFDLNRYMEFDNFVSIDTSDCYSIEELHERGKKEIVESGVSEYDNLVNGFGLDNDKMAYTHILAHVGPIVSHVFYLWEYHDAKEAQEEEQKGGYWLLVSNKVEHVESANLDSSTVCHAQAYETEHKLREERFKEKTDRSVYPALTKRIKVAEFSCSSHCSRPPKKGKPGERFSMRVNYSGVKNDILAENEENNLNYETRMTFKQRNPTRVLSIDGDCYAESKLGAANRANGLVAGVSTWPTKGLWGDPDSHSRLNLRDNTVWSVFPEGPEGEGKERWLELTYFDIPYGYIDAVAKTTWYYQWVPSGEEPPEEPPEEPEVEEDEPPEPEEEEKKDDEAKIVFVQENLGLPANKDKFVIKSEDKKKNKVGLDEYRIPFVVLNMPTNAKHKVTTSLRRMGAAGENGIYLKEDDIKEPIPYSVEAIPDKKYGEKGLYEAVIKETGTYELPSGTNEGILLTVVAESGKKGDKDYVKAKETFPIYRIHLGLSLMLQANTIPCYWEMKEQSRYKLDKEGFAGNPVEDPDDKYVIRQDDFEVPMREGSMLLLLYDEDREDFVRMPAVPSETRVTPSKVENNRFCKTFEASENYQPLVDKLAIMTFPTGKKRANMSHIVKIAPTGGVLDAPLRLLADLEVDTVLSNRTTGVARTFTAKKRVLLHSQPMRVIETSDDECKYLEHDEHIFKQLERIMIKIEKSWPDRLFSLHNMIERMIEGYDYRFGYDEHQVKTAITMYVDFIEGKFEGANGTPYKVTYGDELKACYAFMQGLRDNTGFLGRMAIGVLTGGVSEHVFTTMTVLEKMQQEIYTCKDANDSPRSRRSRSARRNWARRSPSKSLSTDSGRSRARSRRRKTSTCRARCRCGRANTVKRWTAPTCG